jgi:hypothetical protein
VSGNIGGQTLAAGLYKSTSSLAISSGDLTLSGSASDVWIFQIASTLTTTSGRKVVLSGGAQSSNIFWQVGTSATLGTNSIFYGTIMANQSITLTTGAILNGRALASTGAVTLDTNTITVPGQAAPHSVIITSPTSSSQARTHASGGTGSVTVTYNLPGPGSDSNNISIQIVSGSTVAGSAAETRASNTTGNTIPVPILASATAGTYDVVIQDGNGHSYTSSGSVVINNTIPTATVSVPNSGSGWSAVPSPVTQNTLSFSVSSLSTVNVYLQINGGGYTLINAILSPNIPIGSAMSATYYTGTIASNNALLTSGYSGLIKINATDQYGNYSGDVFSQPFSLSTQGPLASVTTPNQQNAVYNGGTISTITGSITPFTNGSTASYQIGLFNTNTPTSAVSPSGLVDLISGGWQSGTVTNGTLPISYSWHVENNVSGTNYYIGIQGKDSVGTTGAWAFSQYAFRIMDVVKPTATILWPTSSVCHYSGASDNVTWTMTDNVPGNLTYSLWLSTNGGSTWTYLIAASNAPQGTASVLPWLIPGGISSTNCVITENVSDNENPANVQTIRSGTFSIVTGVQPTSTMTLPIGGENWAVGNTQNITWTSSDTSCSNVHLNYTIQFTADGGTNWATIATLTNMTQGSNTYSWAVANPHDLNSSWPNVVPNSATTATNCRISVTTLNPYSGLSYTVSSPSPFTISPGTTAVTTATVTMQPGWNLISLPLVPTNSNIQNVLGTSISSIASVWTCSGGGTTGGSWSVWAPGSPSGLSTMVDGKAYWVNVNGSSPVSFTFQGRTGNPPPSAPPTYSMPAGWNMVGYKSTLSTHTVVTYLGNATGTGGASVYSLPITGYSSGAFTSLNSTDTMTSGQGYWVYYNIAGIITPPSD